VERKKKAHKHDRGFTSMKIMARRTLEESTRGVFLPGTAAPDPEFRGLSPLKWKRDRSRWSGRRHKGPDERIHMNGKDTCSTDLVQH